MNFRISFITILTLCLVIRLSFGQQKNPPQALSLREAREIALKNNPNQQLKAIQVTIAQKQVEQAKWEKIPELYANFDLKRNLIIPTTPVPAEAFDPNAKPGTIKPLKFQTDWTSNAGINAHFDIFNPNTHGAVIENQKKAAMKSTQQKMAANDLKFQINKEYAAVVIAQKQWKLAISDTVNKHKILKMTKEQYKAGRLTTADLNQIITEKHQAKSNYLKTVKILASAKAQLLTDMGYDPSQDYSITLTDSLSILLSAFRKNSFTKGNSLSLKKWKQQQELTQLQLQHTRQEFLPTIALKGFYGGNYFNNDFQLFKGENWYGNSYIGLSINIPITKGIDRVKKISILQLQHKADQTNYQAQKNKRQLAITQAQQEIEYRKKDLLNKKKEWHLTKENFMASQDKFLNGRLLIGDFSKSNFLFEKAKTNYLQAAYDLIIAQMKWRKIKRE